MFSGVRKVAETCCPSRASSVSSLPLVMLTAKTPSKEMHYDQKGAVLGISEWGPSDSCSHSQPLLRARTCSVLTTEVVND